MAQFHELHYSTRRMDGTIRNTDINIIDHGREPPILAPHPAPVPASTPASRIAVAPAPTQVPEPATSIQTEVRPH